MDDMQDELKNLLFGEETRSHQNSSEYETEDEVSLYDFDKYDEYDEQEIASRRSEDDLDIPIAVCELSSFLESKFLI